jgi:hypothetical protein
MASSSDEYWMIDGVSLHQYGWSVATVGGSRYDLPPRRGENIQLAYRHGRVHRRKYADSRTIELIMWVTGVDPATGNSVDDARLQWNDSWDFLRRLVWKPNGAQVTLTRRWFLTVDGVRTMVASDAQAEIADTMAPTMTGRHRADFTMVLLLADPYFYGDQVVETLGIDQPVTVTNTGYDEAISTVQVDLRGPLTNPKVTNAITSPNVWFQYNGIVPAGQVLRLDVGAYTATQTNTVTPTPPVITAMRAVANGKYVCAENAGAAPLIANRDAIGLWEQFNLIDAGSGFVALQSRVNNKYVTTESAGQASLIANRTVIGLWEKFRLLINPDTTVSLQSDANGKYVTAENAGGKPLIANRDAIGPWEKFQFTDPAYQVGNVVGAITHGGARSWLGLLPGENILTLTAESGTGSAVLRFRPPHV